MGMQLAPPKEGSVPSYARNRKMESKEEARARLEAFERAGMASGGDLLRQVCGGMDSVEG